MHAVPGSRGPCPAARQQYCREHARAPCKRGTSHLGVPSDHVHPAGRPGPPAAPGAYRKGSLLAGWLSSTDHKVIGHLYLITSFVFFLIAGLMAMIMRAQLAGRTT